MTSVSFPTYTGPDLFANYTPSANAHTDIISPSGGSGQVKTVKTIKLTLKTQFSQPTSKDLLSILLPSISLILAGKRTEPSFHHLSSACHRLVLPPLAVGPTIYLRVNEELTQSVTGLAREWRGSIMGREAGWLGRLVEGTKGWEKRVSLLSAVLVYLDRVYCNESTGIASIKELAIVTFRKGIWENQLLFQKTRDDLLSWASGEREAGATNADLRPTIQSITALSKLLGAFTSLSAPYLEDLTSYYTKLAELKLSEVDKGEMSPSRYVQWLLERVEEERERGKTCFDDEVAERAVESVREELGTKIQERIVRRALDEAMDLVDSQALSRLFRFSVDTHVFTTFNKALQDYIETRLRKLIFDPKNDPQMIEETLKLKKFTDKAVTELFIPAKTGAPEFSTGDTAKSETTSPNKVSAVHPETSKPIPSLKIGAEDDVKEDPKPINGRGEDDEDKMELDDMEHPNDANPEEELIDETEEVILPPLDRSRQLELQDAVRAGFKAGMGSRQNAPAEWIAKHLDQVMRRGQGSGTESAFNALLDEIIALIGFTRDKDVFKAFYSSQLAKRLLLNKSASNDMERNMIVKLQKEMGEEFTTGDVMMKDLGLSETLVKTYQSHLSKSSLPDPTNLSANVLTESAWPAYPLLKDGWAFKLTPELQSSVDEFTKWYATQHKNRQLSWRWQLATVTLTGRFAGGRYEIGVSLFQAVVLLQFNEVDELDFKEIKERTGIESSELIRILQSLSIGRKGTRVLLKRPPVKEVLPTDTFRYHKSFTSDRLKFRINQIQQDMSAEESQKTNEQVAIDRVSVLEATIVRIMKGKKKLTLAGLIDSVVGEVSRRFPPDVREIKRRVESLIEREFLMRDEEDRNLLHYLA